MYKIPNALSGRSREPGFTEAESFKILFDCNSFLCTHCLHLYLLFRLFTDDVSLALPRWIRDASL